MRTTLTAGILILLLLFSPLLLLKINGQELHPKAFPTDSSLRALANKYIHSPITKTVQANGEIFLQRDMSQYLQGTVSRAPEPTAAALDHGHDHKDAMLRAFLNRPHPSVATMNKFFHDAAIEFHVPEEILKAAAQVQSNWAQVSESMYGSWGIMGLVENQFVQQISKAATLLKVKSATIENDARTNIRAAAALLAFYQKGKPASPEITSWFESVKSLTALRDAAMSHELAIRIFDLMKTGSKTVTLWGEIITINPFDVTIPEAIRREELSNSATSQNTEAVDYPKAIPNFTSCNFGNRPPGSPIRYYFVHYVATGTYQGAISWFKDCSSAVSAHYVIRNNDGEVSQVVAENDRAWSQGVTSYNDMGIGVEHEVLATNLSMWDSEPMLVAAANLCMNVCNRRSIPKMRRVTNGDAGIYGHSDVRATDCPNLTDARWSNFISRVNSINVAPPVLYSIANAGNGTQVTATWKANIDPDLAGYRLYYATSDTLTSWALAADETTLNAGTSSVTLDAAHFVKPPSGDVYHFKLTAVAFNGPGIVVESSSSDVYSRSSNTSGPKLLIVDGFDRTNGSYTNSYHSFVTSYFKSLRNKALLQVSSVANEKVEDGTFLLNDYDLVVWFVGDESTANVVLSASEKTAIKNYLDNGGKLLISGSEIAFNIGRAASATYDLPFMTNYLRSSYVSDGVDTYSPATGMAGTTFEGLKIPFGITYIEDYPDAVSPVNGSASILNYNVAPNKAGVAYKGIFGTGTAAGALIFLSFTLETAADTSITSFMGKALAYFDVPVITIPAANDDAATLPAGTAKRINLLANDYNNGTALNAQTLTITGSPANGSVTTDNAGIATYISKKGFVGHDEFRYKVQNLLGEYSNNATVSLTVTAFTACDANPPEVEDLTPKRDLRGAWVSTVSNIDWPSSRTLTTAQQQAELIRILDTLSKTGINTVFLQVRPEADALYASSIDPWSYWLTNAQGTAPNPFWDPLSFAVSEAHARGMELHAWLNPYRAKQSTPVLAATHVAVQHPDWTFISGTLTMLNPGLPQVRDYLTKVIADIASRYDIDGIHFDDYFYPAAGMAKQDSATFADYNPDSIAAIEDWRRDNVNQLIANVYDTLAVINAALNRNILFGVSPFGIWKSGTPAGISGTSSFSALYCDPIAWMQAGKVDYIAPQLYWKITGAQDYNALSKWWNDQGVAYNRYVYPGLALYKMNDANNWASSEIENQIILNRDQNHEQVKGQVLFSTQQIMANSKGVKTALQINTFHYPSIPPAIPWKDVVCPNAPVNTRRDGDSIRWEAPSAATDGDMARKYVVYRFANPEESLTHMNDGRKVLAVLPGDRLAFPVAGWSADNYFRVTALDKNNNESGSGIEAPLPVTGLELALRLSGSSTIVNWSTLTEINTKSFDVERSSNGQQFRTVASVAANGLGASKTNYSITDLLPAPATYFYRIRSIDRDGKFSYSPVKSIDYRNAFDGIVAGPNPFHAVINISNLSGVKRLEIIDLAGRTVFSKTISGQANLQLDLSGLRPGFYTLKATGLNNRVSLVKMVKR